MFVKNQKGRLGRIIFITKTLLDGLYLGKGEMLSNLSKEELYHKRLSYREMAMLYKLNLEMYKMLCVSGRPFSFTDNFNELEKASFDKLLEELSTNAVIDNLLREVKNYNILKIGNDLVFLMDTKESSNKNSSVTGFTKLSSNNLLEAILEAVVNNHGYFETHFQMIKRTKDNELGTENIYRAMLVS